METTHSDDLKVLHQTWSVCPVCLKRLPAERVQIGTNVFLRKTCAEHGTFESIIWRGRFDIHEWMGETESPALANPRCPDGCGLCPDHLQKTCCVLLNITSRCNLDCRFCFADQGGAMDDPPFEAIRESLANLVKTGKTLVQLSGGEPTVRSDLPDIIHAAKAAGLKYVQLNTNGVRLGEDQDYVRALADAGLSFVFMQFDGTEDAIYEELRGQPLLKIKQNAIKHCAAQNLGVTLVPTIVRGINTQNIGETLKFAISQSPNVRGVHFQPVSFIGRAPEHPTDHERITLDELICEIEQQTDGMIRAEHLVPSHCNHPLCGFHGDFLTNHNEVIPLLKREKPVQQCCCNSNAADKRRAFLTRRWQRPALNDAETASCCGDIHDMEYFLKRIKTHGFTVTAMAFQDADTLDFTRLRSCSLHVYDKGRFVPFCAYYLSGRKQ
ncbi:MAG: radical SAM protein [Candidatus Vecturithrix sp.]|jgi:uncharacterized radical SAM superfamily Fe-S cluster-containing enzyme|nr:radical SAM protein [Candidatus Vecturithrix sp.]